MSSKKQHINQEHRLPEEWEEVVGKTQPKFNKSKDAVWSEMMSQIDEQPQETKVIQMNWFRYAAAAVLVLALTSASFVRFYTQTITTSAGQHASALLPDGSKVELNAASEISFHPYWWRFERKVEFEGEAFFEVEKGSKFSVVSANGITEVLGTSFNINSRTDSYQVLCVTGQVRVSNAQSNVVLNPKQQAVLDGEDFKSLDVESTDEYLAWVENKFVFNGVSVAEVVAELELQYDVKITIQNNAIAEMKYSGNFPMSIPIDSTLEIISQGLGVSFTKSADGVYLLSN